MRRTFDRRLGLGMPADVEEDDDVLAFFVVGVTVAGEGTVAGRLSEFLLEPACTSIEEGVVALEATVALA